MAEWNRRILETLEKFVNAEFVAVFHGALSRAGKVAAACARARARASR